jgi:hypothetical protein
MFKIYFVILYLDCRFAFVFSYLAHTYAAVCTHEAADYTNVPCLSAHERSRKGIKDVEPIL